MDMDKDHVIASVYNASQLKSKLSPEVFDVKGYCPPRIRCLLNNLCNFPGCRYLEVGTFNGASLISAAYQNEGEFSGIDNFCQFGNDGSALYANLAKFKPNVKFYMEDSWQIDLSLFHDIDVYFYDGDHSRECQERGIVHFFPTLAREFVLLVDDYSWADPRGGTEAALGKLNIEVCLKMEIQDGYHNQNGWWNGLLIAYCKKVRKMF